MLAEIRDLRAHTNISLMKHQEEREKMTEQLSTIEDQTTKKERQAKRQGILITDKIASRSLIQSNLSNPTHHKGPCVGLQRMSEYSGVGLHKFHCIWDKGSS